MGIRAGKTCVIYCRVSSDPQVKGTSLETQEEVCRDYAARNGLDVLDTFVEEGESAKTADRTKFIEAIEYCTRKKNRVDFFVYHKLDRSARFVEDYFSVRAQLRRAGTTLRSATEPIDSTPTGKLMETMLAGIAEFDNNVRAERSKAGMVSRVRQGFWCWVAPLGYHRPAEGSNIAPDPATAPHIRFAFEEYAKGFVTYRGLAKRLNQRGLRSINGKMIRYQTVEQILKNPIYCGIIKVWGEQHVGSFAPIVSESLWRQCEARYKAAAAHTVHSAPRSANNPLFPLRNLVRCSHCGDSLTGSCPTNKQGRSYPYYHHWRRGCPAAAKSVPKRVLEERFVELLRRSAPTEEVLRAWRLVIFDTVRYRQSGKKAQYSERERIQDALRLERQRIFELHRQGTYADDDFREQLRLLDARIKESSLLHGEEAAGESNLVRLLDAAMPDLQHPAERWLELEPDYQARLRLQERVFEQNLLWNGDDFDATSNTTFRLIYRMNQGNCGTASGVVPLVRENWSEIVRELKRWWGAPA